VHYLKKYIGKRIISFLIVLVGVSILSFLLIAWSGKDPAEIIAHRGVSNPTPEQIEMIRVKMGLDQPLPVRYIQWLSGMFTGELGTSLTTHQPIVKDLHKYLATTTSLVGMAILWIIVLTVALCQKAEPPFRSGYQRHYYLRHLCANFLAGIPSSTVLCDSSEMVQCLTKSRLEGLFTTFICPGGSQFVFTHPNHAFLSSG
jgi:hypothetical protein